LNTFGLSIRRIRFSFISDDDLTKIITNIINEGDELGNLFNISNTALPLMEKSVTMHQESWNLQ